VDGLSAVVQDVSRSGIALQVDEPVRFGEIHQLHLTDAIDESAASLEAEVVWLDGKRAGLRWCNLTFEQESWLRARLTGCGFFTALASPRTPDRLYGRPRRLLRMVGRGGR
jgi:hypothetical protein